MTKKNPNVYEIVEWWLRANGYNGLYTDDCGCHVDDLIPCNGDYCVDYCMECLAGYNSPKKAKENDSEIWICGEKD